MDDEESSVPSQDEPTRQIKCESSPPTPRASRVQQLQQSSGASTSSSGEPVNR